jgi:hypothetical protein
MDKSCISMLAESQQQIGLVSRVILDRFDEADYSLCLFRQSISLWPVYICVIAS